MNPQELEQDQKRTRRSFIVLVVIAVLVTGWIGQEEVRNRRLTRQNERAIRAIESDQIEFARFRIQRARDVNETTTLICRKQNAESAILSDIIRRLLALPPPPGQTPAQIESRRILKQAVPKLKPEDCTNLPTAPGANPKGSP